MPWPRGAKLNKKKAEVVKESWREKGDRVEVKRRCWKRVSSDVFEDFDFMTEWLRMMGILWVFRCVCACCFFVCDCCDCCACCACFPLRSLNVKLLNR